MSQKVSRKGPVGDDKEKGQTDSPVKEMKKKMAANAEKEKQAAEKHAEKDKDKEKPAEKQPEKAPEKADKSEKVADKKEKAEKSADKKEKQVEKEKEKAEKGAEKKNEAPAEKPKEDNKAKPDKPDDKATKSQQKPKQNGARANGLPAAETQNGDHSDGTVSSGDEMVIDHERDDMFPELAYDDSDGDFEPPTPEGVPSRSYTRRSQAKVTRTPETPRPASDKRSDKETDDSKESKVLKLKDDVPVTDRKLRSSDSPKPESKKPEKAQEKKEKDTKEKESKEKEIVKEAETTNTDKSTPTKKDLELPEAESEKRDDSVVEIVIDLDADEDRRKSDTNYSRSRVKVSPYRRGRAERLDRLDRTASSLLANYTGNNTTMEMDITESSLVEEDSGAADSPYLSGLRSIRGRRSYKPLKEMALRNISVNRSVRSTTSVTVTEQPSRPMAPVVGRKRKPEGEGSSELASEVDELALRGKRARLLDKLARPFRSVAAPSPARRNAEIVGINTDLPLTAPVAAPDTFDPETLKPSTHSPTPTPTQTTPAHTDAEKDTKRCSIM